MRAVDGEIGLVVCHCHQGGVEDISETHLQARGDFSHSFGVSGQTFIVEISGGHPSGVLIGDGGDQYDLRSRAAIVSLGFEFQECLSETGFEGIDLFETGEGFVVAEGRENDVGLFARKVLRDGGEIIGTWLQIDLVSRPC